MNQNTYLHIAAYQGNPIEGNINAALQKTIEIAKFADLQNIDILCLPESFLCGYFETKKRACEHSVDLNSSTFEQILESFKAIQTTVLLGLNEHSDNDIYNTVVIIDKGKCLGKYRKSYTYKPYDYYTCGNDYPIFEKKGIKYGIIVCYDSLFFEPSRILALKGADILFCPSFNRISKNNKFLTKMHRRSHFVSRAFENNCWFVVSDIIWDNDEQNVCPGYSCILNNDGVLMAASEPFSENLISYLIPIKNLKGKKMLRLKGKAELQDQIYKLQNENS